MAAPFTVFLLSDKQRAIAFIASPAVSILSQINQNNQGGQDAPELPPTLFLKGQYNPE